MISSVAEEIANLQEGLSLFGVFDELKSFPDDALKYFVCMELTAEDIRGTFVPSFSLQGSSRRPSEETVMFHFNQFLRQCERGEITKTFIDITSLESAEETQQVLTLHDASQFMTGARHIPPNGLQGIKLTLVPCNC